MSVENASPRKTRSNSMTGVSLSNVKQLLISCKNELIDTFKTELRKISDVLESVKVRVECIEVNLSEIKETVSRHDDDIKEIKESFVNAESNLFSFMSEEMEERIHRMNNVIISGIPEIDGSFIERKDHDFNKVLDVALHLNPSFKASCVKDVHRIGKIKPDQTRLLRMTLVDYNNKISLLRNAKKLRSITSFRNVYVNTDRTRFQAEEFKNLRNEFRNRKERGEDVMIYRNKVIEREHAPFQNFP